jgi:cytochrome P450
MPARTQEVTDQQLPPGPRQHPAIQTAAWWNRPIALMERCRKRYGTPFTLRLMIAPPIVMVTDPETVKEIFTAAPDVLHPGEGTKALEPVIGRNSVILLDEQAHLAQRKLMLPAFHGERMERLTDVVAEVTEREVASWPRDEQIALHPRLQALTLEVILRAVFGLDEGPRLDALRTALNGILDLGSKPLGLLPFLQRDLGPLTQYARFARLRDDADRLIYELIDERRAEADAADGAHSANGNGAGPGGRDDVLAMLLAARHEDGAPMRPVELRDELMTLLVAGHETTASELAWAFERLTRTPRVLRTLVDEVDRSDGEAYLTATIQETLRRRPVLTNAAPRLVKQPVEIGGWAYPVGVALAANAYLIHHDPAIYPNPYEFRPERFLEEAPGTYTWIPFGGGRRRCLGASFALMEMKIVLREVLAHNEVRAAGGGMEISRRRSITVSPRRGALVVLHARKPVAAAERAAEPAAA